MATLAKPQHFANTNAKHRKSVLPLYHRTGESAGDYTEKAAYVRDRSQLLDFDDLTCLI